MAPDRRIRLNDDELDILVVALRQFASGKQSLVRQEIAQKLIDQFIERRPGRR